MLYYLQPPGWGAPPAGGGAAPVAGGSFRAYPDASAPERCVDLAPAGDRLLAFWSDSLVREVTALEVPPPGDGAAPELDPAHARWALTVWLCVDDLAEILPTDPRVEAAHFAHLS